MKITINNTKFLDKETDIKHKDTLKIASEGAWEVSTKFKKDDGTPSNQFTMNFTLANGEERSTILSFANVKLLVQAFGDETESWIGKEVRAWKTKSEKAKLGYTYLYVPVSWERDDTGEWITGDVADTQETPDTEDSISIDEIPF